MGKIRYFLLTLLCLLFSAGAWADNWDQLDANRTHQNNMKRDDLGAKYRFYIREAMDLACYVYMLNNSENNNVEFPKYNNAELIFEADIDLNGHTWRAISEQAKDNWKGSIDGRGHTIRNMKLGNNKHWSGLIDTADGETSVKNLTFENCENLDGEYDSSILIGSVMNRGKMTVENVHFKNCRMNVSYQSGFICGLLYENSEMTINNVSIRNCTLNSGNIKVGGGIGFVQNSTLNVSDVVMENVTVKGDYFVGAFIGKLESNCKMQINNLTVRNADVTGEEYLGGIIGEWQGTGWMKNSRWTGKLHSGKYKECGGLVGKFYGAHTSVTIDNCVADVRDASCMPQHSGNIGGAVGFAGSSAAFTLLNTTVLSDCDKAYVPSSSQGLLIGNSEGSCHITVENCHADDGYIRKTPDIMLAAFGSNIKNMSNLIRKNITSQSTLEENSKALFYIAKSNEMGSMMAPGFVPLTSTDGMVVRYKNDVKAKVRCQEIADRNVNHEGYSMAIVGREMTYTFPGDNNKWIVEDSSEGIKNAKRTGATSFSGLPSDDKQEKHILNYLSVDRPNLAITEALFDRDRQATSIKWAIKNQEITDTYWKKGGYWQVLRDGVVIADSVPYATMQYFDENCPLGKKSEYTINLVSPVLYFNGDQVGTFKQTINCYDSIQIQSSLKHESLRRTITAMVPNSKRFNGCRVNLYRITNEDLLAANESVTPLLVDANLIESTTYEYQQLSTQSQLAVTLYDNSQDRPCTMFHYYVVCDNFKDEFYTGRTFMSDDMPVNPSQSVAITTMNAAKGESTDKVKIDWKSSFTDAPVPVRYTLWRKKYNPSQAAISSSQDSIGWTMIYEVDNNYVTNSYTDQALPGYVYRYRLRASVGCDGVITEDLYDDERTDIGYTASRGTIMGNIAFSTSNTNVEGVDVRLALDELSMTSKSSTAYSRYFSGGEDSMPLAMGIDKSFWHGNWTLQFLLRPLINTEKKSVLSIPGLETITLQNDTLFFGNKEMQIKGSDYTRMLISHTDGRIKIGYADTPTQTGGSYTNWIIDVAESELKSESNGQDDDTILFGAIGSMKSFNGMLDEVRLWDIALNDSQVKTTYDRYLTGNESNLAAYYTFDSGVVEYAFDESHPDGIWNKHHSILPVIVNGKVLPSLRSDLCPSEEVLCYRGTTDRNGEYQIAGIPFTGEGTNYMVVPIYGTHEFQPSSTRRYVSSQSLTHSEVNFKDVSSFPVDIQAYYALGNYPAEGLTVIIDNTSVTDSEGMEIQTDQNGRCTVSVPVGKHRIFLRGLKHTMVNDGYPCSIDTISDSGIITFTPLQGKDKLIDFQASPVAPFTFYDNTYARVAGRVVGGNVESEKPLGGNLSNANLGQVAITLEPSVRSGYHMNNDEKRDIVLNQRVAGGEDYDEVIESTTTYLKSSSDIVVHTDPTSGEFIALVPPVSMRIKDIHTTGSKGKLLWEDFNTGNQSDLITIDMTNEDSDSIKVNAKGEPLAEEDCRVFKYQAKKIYSYFVDPEISVVNPDNSNGDYPMMLGDSIWVNKYEEIVGGETKTIEDKVDLWNPNLRDGSPDSYMLNGVPVFTQGNDYSLDISLFERYHNCDTGRDSLYYIPNVEINIKNALATQTADVKVTNGVMEYSLATDSLGMTLQGEAEGKTRYTFSAGFPNPLPPYTLDMSMSYTTNGKVYTYPEEGSIKGIVLGFVNVPGTDFTTAGPDFVSFVLRDPPGGSSSAWIEQGTTISSSASFENGAAGTNELMTTAELAMKKQTYSGTLSIEPATVGTISLTMESKKMSGSEQGVTTTVTHGRNKSAKFSYTMTEKLQTSNSASYVGSQADIYVGCSTNFIFSKSRVLGLRKSSVGELQGDVNSYALEQYDGMSRTIDFPTAFHYSQRHILQELIPGWKELRRSCVDEIVNSFDGLPLVVSGDKPRYYVLPTTSDKKDIWISGEDYVCVYPNKKDACFSDTISTINNNILNWQRAIENNERIKVQTMRDMNKHTYKSDLDISLPATMNIDDVKMEWGYMGNLSYDAGASLTQSITREFNETDGASDAITVQAVWNKKWEIDHKLIAYGEKTVITTKAKDGYTRKDSKSHSTTDKQTFGYTLSDSKAGNYYSVDVWLPGELDESGTLADVAKGGKPKFDEFFVFRLSGGQSKDPYEPEEYTLFYKENGEPVKLSNGTIAIEDPKVTLAQNVFTDIPNGQKFTFPITLSNISTANVKLAPTFTLNIDGATNPDGLKFSVDGMELRPSGGFEVLLMPGQTMQKMVTVEQSRTDITHYEDVAFRFACSNEPGRAYSEKVSFHYKPASSPVTFAATNNVVNSSTPEMAATFTVSDYQPEFENFAGIRIQYKSTTENSWHTATVLVNDSTRLADLFGVENFPDVWEHLDRKADKMRFRIPMDRIADGNYIFRAQSFSPVGKADEVTTESEELSILKDTAAPSLLTHPTPENGFYTGRENISIEMNEPIDMALLTPDNFSVTGVLNDAEVRHMSGLHFDGDTPARTQSRVNVFGKSSAIAFWYKPQVGKNSCLLSQKLNLKNNVPAKLALFYNDDASLTLQLGDETYKSTRRAVDNDGRAIDDWMYATIIIDRENSTANVFNLFGTSTQAESHFLEIQQANVPSDCNVPLYIGGSQDGDECHADMEELVLFEGAQEFAAVASYKDNRHYDHLNILSGYWPMDEGHDMMAADKVRSRNLILNGTDNWYMPVTNYAVHFDGKSQYIKVKTEKCTISSKQNYALDFYFRSDSNSLSNTQTLFSNGWGGAGSNEPSVKDRLSLSLTKEGHVLLETAGSSYTLGKNFADRNWHHLLLSVERCGYARVFVDDEDISGNTNIAGTDLGAFANAQMVLGALVYNDGGETLPQASQFFEGDIDEVRVWNVHNSQDPIKTMSNSRLRGDEVGLVAYYPFEHTKIVSNQLVTEPWLEDCVQKDELAGILPASSPEYVGNPDISANGPRLKAAGVVQPIAMEFTHNGVDRIMLTFPENIDNRRIEKCTLTFSIKNLQDLAGNKMPQPVVWSLYVEQKAIVARISDTELTQEIGHSVETTLGIYNDFAKAQRWKLEGLPSWITAEQTSAMIEPFSTQHIKLTTSEGAPIGKYSAVLLVTGEDNLTNYLHLDLNVTSIRPNWIPEETDGSVWMSLFGRLKVNDTWSTDENDMVGAFTSDGRCLGVASPEYNESMSTYFLNMNIRGNNGDEGKDLYFCVWDADNDITYTDTELSYELGGQMLTNQNKVTLKSTHVLGNFTNPCNIATRDVIRQTMSLHTGWNWVSFWVDPKVGKKASDVFAPVTNSIREVKARLKGYSAENLRLLNLSPAQAYLVYANEPVSFSVEGTQVDPASVQEVFIHPSTSGSTRWQWLGFPQHTTMTLQTAFSDFVPSLNDVVKSEDAFAMYNGNTWVGNLKYLVPGMGYMYGYHADDNKDIEWNYPSQAKSMALSLDVDPYDFENFTFVQVKVDDLSFEDGRYQLAAIGTDDKVHGLEENTGNVFPLNIYGVEGDEYHFKIYDRQTGEEVTFRDVYVFDALTPGQTHTLSVKTAIDSVETDDADAPWYDLGGLRIGDRKPSLRGVFIHDNKKQVNK